MNISQFNIDICKYTTRLINQASVNEKLQNVQCTFCNCALYLIRKWNKPVLPHISMKNLRGNLNCNIHYTLCHWKMNCLYTSTLYHSEKKKDKIFQTKSKQTKFSRSFFFFQFWWCYTKLFFKPSTQMWFDNSNLQQASNQISFFFPSALVKTTLAIMAIFHQLYYQCKINSGKKWNQ